MELIYFAEFINNQPMPAPIVPVGFEPMYGTSTSVTLTWDDSVIGAPAQTPTTYSVWTRRNDSQPWTLAAPPRLYGYGRNNYVDIVDLQPQTSYQYKLRATNPFGSSETQPLTYVTTTYVARP